MNKAAACDDVEPDALLGQVNGYWERPLQGRLREHFTCAWSHAPRLAQRSAIVPDGCADIIFVDGQLRLCGPDTEVRMLALPPGAVVVGLRFQAGAAAHWLKTPARDLTAAQVPLDVFWGADAQSLGDWIAEGETAASVAQIMERAFDQRIGRVEAPGTAPTSLLRMIAGRSNTSKPLTSFLTQEFGWSARTLRRRSEEWFGFGAKTLERILRFQRFLDLASTWPNASTAQLAALAGYADQAHLARESRTLAGLTPTTVRRQLSFPHGRRSAASSPHSRDAV